MPSLLLLLRLRDISICFYPIQLQKTKVSFYLFVMYRACLFDGTVYPIEPGRRKKYDNLVLLSHQSQETKKFVTSESCRSC